MAVAGFCSQCGQNVFLDDQWSCPSGHGWNAVTSWYDTATGQPVTPPWHAPQAVPSAPAAAAPVVAAAPTPAPVASAPPPDPAVQLRRMIRDRMEDLGLKVADKKGVYSASRGKEYECAVAVDAHNGRVLLWERLREGRDPGVRDAVRSLAGEHWAVKVVLRQSDVAG